MVEGWGLRVLFKITYKTIQFLTGVYTRIRLRVLQMTMECTVSHKTSTLIQFLELYPPNRT